LNEIDPLILNYANTSLTQTRLATAVITKEAKSEPERANSFSREKNKFDGVKKEPPGTGSRQAYILYKGGDPEGEFAGRTAIWRHG
jgi:hypothetical protein